MTAELSSGAKISCAVNQAINHGRDNTKSKKICGLQDPDMGMGKKVSASRRCEREEDARDRRQLTGSRALDLWRRTRLSTPREALGQGLKERTEGIRGVSPQKDLLKGVWQHSPPPPAPRTCTLQTPSRYAAAKTTPRPPFPAYSSRLRCRLPPGPGSGFRPAPRRAGPRRQARRPQPVPRCWETGIRSASGRLVLEGARYRDEPTPGPPSPRAQRDSLTAAGT